MEKYSKKKIITVICQFLAMAGLIGADLLIKQYVITNIELFQQIKFIDGFIGWTYIQNTGMAWGMFNGNPQMLSVFTGVLFVLGSVYLLLPTKRPLAYDICIPLILSGGAANMIERIIRGFVVDYIQTLFVDFPVYNFADCLITCGSVAFMIYLIYEIVIEYKNKKNNSQEENDSAET